MLPFFTFLLQKEKEIVDRKLEERKEKWKRFVEEYELEEQRRRNAEKAIQKEKDLVKYINVFGMVGTATIPMYLRIL